LDIVGLFRRRALRHFGADAVAQLVDRHDFAPLLDMPEGPAIAGGGILYPGTDLMDRTPYVAGDDAAIGMDFGGDALADIEQLVAGAQQAALDHRAKRDARRAAFFRCADQSGRVRQLLDRIDARVSDGDIVLVAFDADPVAPETFGDCAGRAGAEEGIEDSKPRCSSDSGFWVGCDFFPASRSRSAPPQIGSSQSLRIWMPSLSAFIA
jgi:hypothetical protein